MAVLSEEQTMIRDGAKSWVQEKSPVTAFRKMRDSGNADGFDRAAWNEMAEMGWAGILIPEEFGGTGLGYLTLGLVLEETGRTLTASPLISTALTATTALLLGGNDAQKKKYLPQIAEGKLIATLAVDEGAAPRAGKDRAQGREVRRRLQAERQEELRARRRHGRSHHRRGAHVGQAGRQGRASRSSSSTARRAVFPARSSRPVDSRGVANLTFANVEVGADAVLGSADQGQGILESTLDRARAGLAAEMLGQAMQSFDVTLDYLKTRVQFGQVIGTFQALQHRAAKMFTDLELGRSCVEGALQAIDRDANDVAQLASLAKAKVGDLVHLVSNEMVQMHGGIGMTDAHDAGLYLKRARAQEATFGGSSYHRDRYATLFGY